MIQVGGVFFCCFWFGGWERVSSPVCLCTISFIDRSINPPPTHRPTPPLPYNPTLHTQAAADEEEEEADSAAAVAAAALDGAQGAGYVYIFMCVYVCMCACVCVDWQRWMGFGGHFRWLCVGSHSFITTTPHIARLKCNTTSTTP